ncbi:MAG: hypothetical protein ACYC8T_09915 [Myxococcaceae bacterium]
MRRLSMTLGLTLALAAWPATVSAADDPAPPAPPSKCADGCGLRMKPCLSRCSQKAPPAPKPDAPQEKPGSYKPNQADDCVMACAKENQACFDACK